MTHIATPLQAALLQPVIPPQKLHTAQVSLTSIDTVKTLAAITKCWLKVVNARSAEALLCQNKTAFNRLDSLRRVLLDVSLCCEQSQKYNFQSRHCYVAYSPEDMHLEGIAICTPDYIEDLATHPKNITISETDKRVAGVGTALIAHICHDIDSASSKKEGRLSLMPSFSSLEFYKKLGFTLETSSCDGELMLAELTLSDKNKEQFTEKYQNVAIKDKELISLEKLSKTL
jgi:hypothetical protein